MFTAYLQTAPSAYHNWEWMDAQQNRWQYTLTHQQTQHLVRLSVRHYQQVQENDTTHWSYLPADSLNNMTISKSRGLVQQVTTKLNN